MSPKLRLKNASERPKSLDVVEAECYKCNTLHSKVFIELVRSFNRQSKYTDHWLCPSCYHNLESFKRDRSSKASKTLALSREHRSRISKSLWENKAYLDKQSKAINYKKTSKEFAEKVSTSIKNKFLNDADYVDRVSKARKKYWDDRKYRESRISDICEFIRKSIEVHGDRYDYSKVSYINSRSKVTIICPEHGEFEQRPSHHIHYANGCPACSLEIRDSRPQLEIAEWISGVSGLDVSLSNGDVLDDSDFDIYIASVGVAVEYHGGFWHSYNSVETTAQRTRHSRKADAAERAGISLLQFFDTEYRYKNDVVKSIIMHKLGLSKGIMARKCSVEKVDRKVSEDFFNHNHIAGYTYAEDTYALVNDGEILYMMSVSNRRKWLEIIRSAPLIGHHVSGGVSKLLSSIIKDKKPTNVFSYADRRYSSIHGGYSMAGMKYIGKTKPGYYYWKNNNIYNRRKFQKHKLINILSNFDESKTEAENMFDNGYRRIWDAGHYRFLWNRYEN